MLTLAFAQQDQPVPQTAAKTALQTASAPGSAAPVASLQTASEPLRQLPRRRTPGPLRLEAESRPVQAKSAPLIEQCQQQDNSGQRLAELESALYTLHAHAERQAFWLRRGIVLALILIVTAGLTGYGAAWRNGERKLDVANEVAAAALSEANSKLAASSSSTTLVSAAGITLPPSANPAVTKLQKAAAAGDYKAQLQLAQLYEAGPDAPALRNPYAGMPRDLPVAQSLLQNAAAGGYPPAMYELGQAYATGHISADGRADRQAAARWLEAAAATGHAAAAYQLGVLYEDGIDGAPDAALALSWYQRAAGYGSDAALAALARFAPKDMPLETADVQALQKTLHSLGYDVGPLDGKLSRRTVDAIRSYQSQTGLTADGRPSHSLLERVRADAGAQPIGQGG